MSGTNSASLLKHYLPPLKLYRCRYKVAKKETTKVVIYTKSIIIPLHFDIIKFLIWQCHENATKEKPSKPSIRSD